MKIVFLVGRTVKNVTKMDVRSAKVIEWENIVNAQSVFMMMEYK